jgi:AraC-like DNA-binding protein
MNLLDIPRASTTAEFQRLHRQLAVMVSRFAKSDGGHQTSIPTLTLFRRSAMGAQFHGVYEPALSIIVQGAKRVMVGDDTFDYDHAHCLVTSVDLPVISQVMRTSQDKPYLGILLDIDPRRIRDLMAEPGLPNPRPVPVGRGMAVSPLSPTILDAVVRLVRLLETPQDIPVLGPLIECEILYRLLLAEMLDVAPASHQVGYASPSQFCREYGRLFGAPPGRDIAQLRLDARAAYYDAALAVPCSSAPPARDRRRDARFA